MANTEHIEAKLCAYVDGELDAAGRADIEAHLQANPQHRQLLAELVEQRELLRALPRVKAPDDLIEAFQTQLERSVLFEQENEEHRIAGRINRWPPIVAAAVLILSVGLVTIIYLMLPEHDKSGDYAAMSKTASAGVEEADEGPTTALATATPPPIPALDEAKRTAAPDSSPVPATPDALALSGAVREKFSPETELLPSAADKIITAAGAASQPEIFSKSPDSVASNAGTSGNFFNTQSDVPLEAELSQRLQQSPAVRDNAMLVLVAANDPSEANRQVTDYLTQNSIRWEPLPEPMPAPVQLQKDEFLASKLARRPMHERMSKGGGERKETEAPAAKGEGVADRKYASRGDVESTGAGAAPNKTASDVQGQRAAKTDQSTSPPSIEPAPTNEAAQPTAPADDAIVQKKQFEPAPAQELSVAQQPFGGQQIQQQQAAPGQQGYGAAQVIVARGLTRQQVADLSSCISQNNAYTCAPLNRTGGGIGGSAAPATQLANLGYHDRDLSAERLRELGAEGVPTTATTQAIESARELTKAKQFDSAPATQVAEAAPTAVPALPPAPTTQVLTPAPVPPEIAEQRFTAGAAAPAPATQALGTTAVTTAPADEPIDVVIVLQSPGESQSPVAAPLPTTAPPAANQAPQP